MSERLEQYEEVTLHGHRVGFQKAGDGDELIALLHGITSTADAWREVMPRLAERYTVVAPDLIGHGRSAKPRGDYSLGAYAAGVRDLLALLGFERATVVGHSFGGGIAMQFSYLFPEYCERLVLISSGGLGRSVNPALRLAALPGAELVTAQLGRAVRLGARAAGALPSFGHSPGPVAAELVRSVAALADGDTRAAFHATLRAVVGPDGQRVFAGDRLYLAEEMPTLIIWGERDPIIPVGHGRRGHAAMPGSHFILLEHAGHFPPLEDPRGVVGAIDEFIRTRAPAEPDPDRFRELLRRER